MTYTYLLADNSGISNAEGIDRKEFEDGDNTITFNDGQLWYG